MKIILIIFLFLTSNIYAQTLKETTDKFENLTSLCLEDMIELDVDDAGTTDDFELNIYKITKNEKVLYAFHIVTETENIFECPEESKCIFLYNDSATIELYSVYRTYQVNKRSLTTIFQIPTTFEELSELKDANKIKVKIYCDGGSYQASFKKDELKEFKNGIKLLMK